MNALPDKYRNFKQGDTMERHGQEFVAVGIMAVSVQEHLCNHCAFNPLIKENCVPCNNVVWMTRPNFILHRLTSN